MYPNHIWVQTGDPGSSIVLPSPPLGNFNGVAVAKDGSAVAFSNREAVAVYDTAMGVSHHVNLPMIQDDVGGIVSFAISGDANVLALAVDEGEGDVSQTVWVFTPLPWRSSRQLIGRGALLLWHG